MECDWCLSFCVMLCNFVLCCVCWYCLGTGWSTSIPSFNPRDIAAQVVSRIKNNGKYSGKPLKPWIKGFNGKVTPAKGENSYTSHGIVNIVGKTKIEVEYFATF